MYLTTKQSSLSSSHPHISLSASPPQPLPAMTLYIIVWSQCMLVPMNLASWRVMKTRSGRSSRSRNLSGCCSQCTCHACTAIVASTSHHAHEESSYCTLVSECGLTVPTVSACFSTAPKAPWLRNVQLSCTKDYIFFMIIFLVPFLNVHLGGSAFVWHSSQIVCSL